MAESFPRDFFGSIGLKPITGIASRRDEGGLNITSRKAEAYWAGPMNTGQLELDEQSEWLGFLSRVVDKNLRVDWVNPAYVTPRAYTLATLPFSGTATLVSLTDLFTPVLSGFNVGLDLRQGDRMTFEQGGVVCYRMVAVDVIVTSATAQSIELTPRLPTGLFTAGADVIFKNPKIRLTVIADSWDPNQVNGPSGLDFQVSEALR